MGLFSNLIEVYDKCSSAVGIIPIEKDVKNPAKALLPLFHSTFKSEFCVTLDEKGQLIKVERDKEITTIIIPMSEKSTSRSSGVAAHPLCDQLAYVDRGLVQDKFDDYIKGLELFKGTNKKLNAIYQYLNNNSVAKAILDAGLFKESELDKQGSPRLEAVAKCGVRFSVDIPNESVSNVWEDRELWDLWINYTKRNGLAFEGFDYILGEDITMLAINHPKNINSITGNAKLISCNDTTNFTFRGRFAEQNDAVLIDAVSSQKAHLSLKWLINNVGHFVDTQVVVTFAVDEEFEEKILPFDNSFSLLNKIESLDAEGDNKTNSDLLLEASLDAGNDYAKKVSKALLGLGRAEKLSKHNNKIVMAIFDAATSGRMGITFYREFPRDKYLEGIANWHKKAAWNMLGFKDNPDKSGKKTLIRYQGCPSFNEILNAAYGSPNGRNDAGYTLLKKNIFRMLLECMFGYSKIPDSLINTAASRVSRPMIFTDSNGSFSELAWRQALNTTCAMIKENYISKFKEDISMELDEGKRDRDYLFGRLLSVAEQIEDKAMYHAGKDGIRTTNALRLMCKYELAPNSTWMLINSQIHPYKCKLKSLKKYQRIINDILALFKDGDFESDKKLSPLYLLGYSNQDRYFYNENQKNIKDSEDETEED